MKKKPLKEESLSTKLFVFFSMCLLAVGAIAFLFGVYYFGILGVMALLGAEYNSYQSLFLFVLFYFLLAVFGDIIIKALSVLMKMSANWSFQARNIGLFIFSFVVNWAIIALLNNWMDSIQIELHTILVISALIALGDVTVEGNDKKNKIH